MSDPTPQDRDFDAFLFIVSEGEVYEVESLSWSSLQIDSRLQQPRPVTMTADAFTELSADEDKQIPF
jgi:hypothetical protein